MGGIKRYKIIGAAKIRRAYVGFKVIVRLLKALYFDYL